MKIYLASRYRRRKEMQEWAARLRSWGHEVVSTWHDTEDARDDGSRFDIPDGELAALALQCYEEVESAECVINFTEEPGSTFSVGARGGRHVEYGIALYACHIQYVIGPREHLFHWMANTHLPATVTPEELRAALEAEE